MNKTLELTKPTVLIAAVLLAGLALTASADVTTCVPAPPGLVGWWAGESNANDSAGTNNGALYGGMSFAAGEAGQAFKFNGGSGYVEMPASAGLDVGAGAGLTFECWIKPAALADAQPLVEWNSGAHAGLHLWISQPPPYGSGSGSIYVNLIDTTGAFHTLCTAAGILNTNSFQHVALSYNKASGMTSLYYNGAQVALAWLGSFSPQTSVPLYLGKRISDAPFVAFDGLLDEVSLYNRALAAAEIQAIYNAGSAGKCPAGSAPSITMQPASQTVIAGSNVILTVTATGAPSPSYQWRWNGTNIAGATATSLTLSNVQPAQAGNYAVLVTNAFGSITSSNALLTVCSLTNGLAVYYPFSGNANDASGNGKNGTVHGATLTADRFGITNSAYSFNGVSSEILVPETIFGATNAAWTLSVWITTDSGPYAGAHMIYTKSSASGEAGIGILDGKIQVGIKTASQAFYIAAAPLLTNSTLHVVGVYQKGQSLSLYINGLLVTNTPVSNENLWVSSFPLTSSLGSYHYTGGPYEWFRGTMDDFRVYTRALSATEVQQLYACESVPPPPSFLTNGLTAYYPFNRNANDASGNGNDGTVNGATLTADRFGSPDSAYRFNGTSWIQLPDTVEPPQPSGLTLSAWVLADSGPYDAGAWLIHLSSRTGEGGIALWNASSCGFWVKLQNSNPQGYYANEDTVITNVWTHLVAVYKQGQFVEFWVNGSLAESNAIPSYALYTDPAFPLNSSIGNYDYAPGPYNGFSGAMDDVRIYNRALSPVEVQALYQYEATPPDYPIITQQPQSRTVSAGSNGTFTATASGRAPLGCQWRLNGTNITGATGTSLTLSNVQPALAGNYTMRVTNIYGSAVSSNAVLTISSPTQCAPPPAGLVSWWAAESNTLDAVGTNNGTLMGGASYASGLVGQAFTFDGVGGYVKIPKSPSLDVGSQVTVEFWVKPDPANLMNTCCQGLVTSDFYHIELSNGTGTNVGASFCISTDSGATYYQTAIAANGGGAVLSPGVWHHVAGTYDGTRIQLFIDGLPWGIPVMASGPISPMGASSFVCIGSEEGRLVCRSCTANRFFKGEIDEASIYKRALSAAEIAAIYNAGSAGKCPLAPPANCTPPPGGMVSWWNGEGNALDSADSNNGTLRGGATFAPGKVGRAFSFDGTNGTVVVPDSPSLRLTSQLSIEAWIYARSVSGDPAIISKVGIVTGDHGYALGLWDNQLVGLLNGPDQAWPADTVASGPLITTGQWQHVAFTYDQSAMKLYVNGTPVATNVIGPQVIAATTTDLRISGADDHTYFNGLVDEPAVYNRALSDAEVAAIYNAGSAGKCPLSVAPSITTQPASQTVLAGSSVTFTATAAGSLPLSYQWRFNGTNLAGATATSLTLSNVQPAQAGNYAVGVANAFGSAISSNAVLTVNPASPCATPPAGLVSWWRAEGDARDGAGTNNGTLQGSVSFVPGRVGQAFGFNGTNSYINAPSSPGLKPTGPFTVEGWVNYDGFTGPNGGAIITKGQDAEAAMDWTLVIGAARDLRTGVNVGGRWVTYGCASTLATGVWYHVALVYDGSSVRVYLNGLVDGTAAASGAVQATDYPLRIGAYAPVNGTANKNYLLGRVDELSLYGRALSIGEIQSIYNAGSAGKCAGPIPPYILMQPHNQVATVGENVTFSATAGGTPPLSYQWQFNSTNIAGGTTAALTLTNVQFSQAGSYALVVTNFVGSITSSNAFLTVNAAPPCVVPPPGLVSWWRAEGDARDGAGTNNGTLQGSVSFVPGRVGQAFGFNGTNSYINAPSSPGLKPTGPFTVEGWVNYDGFTGPNGGAIITKGQDAEAAMDWTLVIGAARDLRTGVNVGGRWVTYGCASTLAAGVWYHVALVYDGSSVRVYLNGLVDGTAAASGAVQATDYPLRIGAYAPVNGTANKNYLLGRVDELSLYSRALAIGEIQGIYNAGSAGKCPLGMAPSITTQPASQTVVAGSNVTFTVTAAGTPPLTYQWRFSGTNLAGTTGTSLTLINVQPAQAGSYTMWVTNAFGSAISSNAVLTVNPASPCATPPAGLLSWWRAEGDARDGAGTNNGTLQGSVSFVPGRVGQAFGFNGTNSYINAPSSPGLKPTGPFTVEGWVNYDGFTGPNGGAIITKGQDAEAAMDWSLIIGPGQKLVPAVNVAGRWTFFYGASTLATGVWYHVAMVYDGGSLRGYVNGALDGTIAASGTVQATDYPLRIGAYAPVNGTASKAYLPGRIDELSFYGRALTAAEIQAIYNADGAGKCLLGAPASITTQPASQTILAGSNVTFAVIAAGTPPLSYQWRFSGTNIAGATGASLTLSNVQPAQAGSYSVLVTNVVGSIISSNAVLTVNSLAQCVSPPAGLVSWWAGEGNAFDSEGANNGTLQGAAGYAAGELGQAFSFDGQTGSVLVPDSSSLRLTNQVTIEAWVNNTGSTAAGQSVVSKVSTATGDNGYAFLVVGNTLQGLFNSPGQGWPSQRIISGPVISTGVWYHVAFTYDQSAMKLYCNGVAVATNVIGAHAIATSASNLRIGNDDSGNSPFDGLIDEASIYNRALSAGEIAAIYQAASAGKCGLPPSILVQPQGQTATAGANVVFSVAASGTPPLSYQWQLNSAPIAGATGTSLVLTNLQDGQAGTYQVVVSNPFGSLTSSNALLTVLSAPPCASPSAGLVSWWAAEGNALDSADSNNGTLQGGATFALGMAGQAFSLDGQNDSVLVPDSSNLRLTNQVTIEAWVNTRSSSAAGSVVSKVSTATGDNGYAFLVVGNTLQGLFNSPGQGWPSQRIISGPVISTGGWYHVAFTYDQSAMKLYCNGVAVATNVIGAHAIATSASNLRIGNDDSGNSPFDGLIDEPGVYNRALSDAEIAGIYNAGSSGKCGLPPSILTQPQSQVAAAGSNITFTVTAAGTPPLSYQWRFSGTNIAGVTGTSLTLSNVQPAQAGSYSVLVTNVVGSVISSNAVLTVNSSSPCAPPPAGLVGWWAGESNALDSTGGNNGSVQGATTFAPGKVGQAFNFNPASGTVIVPDSPSLRLTSQLTIEAWINPRSTNGNYGLVCKDGGAGGNNGYQFVLNGNMLQGLFNSPGQSWPSASISSSGIIGTGVWCHVAFTYDQSAMMLYCNGRPVATNVIGAKAIATSISKLRISGDDNNHAYFDGLIDEPSVYNRALSAAEIASIYNAGSSGKCGFPPSILTQPQGQTATAGANVSFAVAASGTPPLSYQWQLNSAPIAGATASSLVLTNLQAVQAGAYGVVVSNPFGSATSSNAVLSVLPAPPCATPPAGMVSWWAGQGNALDSAGTNNGTLQGGVTFSPGEVGQAFNFNPASGTVVVPDSPGLRLTSQLTIEAWIKARTLSGSGGYVVVSKLGGAGGNNGYQFNLVGNTIQGLFNSPGQAWPSASLFSGPIITTGAWYHVAYTYDQSAMKLYCNGLPVATNVIGAKAIATSISNLHISGDDNSHSYFDGLIDEPAVYNRALSDAEIAAIYNAGSSGKCGFPPSILTQPQDQTATAGANVSFTVAASGSPPLSYQWQLNSAPIAGATASSLVLTNLQDSQAGTYRVVVSNPFGSLTSSNAGLTVLPAPPCATPPTGLVSWWAAEGNALDSADSNNGTLQGATTFAPGMVGQAFNFNPASGTVVVPDSPSLRLTNQLTIEAWIKARTLSGSGGYVIVSKLGGAGGNNGYQFNLVGNAIQGLFNSPGQAWPSASLFSGPIITPGVWYHVAYTYDQSAMKLYCNGQPVATNVIGAKAIATSISNLHISGDDNSHSYFDGLIDEPAVYNRALSDAEIATIYNAGSSGKCKTSGTLLNVNFAAYTQVKVGFAGTGQTASDFWNNYTAPFQPLASLSNLTMADGTPTAVGLTVQNGAGHWAFTHPDLMYNCYCYSQNHGDITVTVTNLPSGQYDFYLYGHARAATANTVFQLLVAGADYGNRATATNSDAASTNFVEGAQYVVYRSVAVTNGGAPVTIKAHPGSTGDAMLNGMQIVTSVLGVPVISAQPTNQATTAGFGASFSVTAYGTQPLGYQWRKGGVVLSGATNPTLQLSNTTTNDAGAYDVVVTNSFGAATSQVATLTVHLQTSPTLLNVNFAAYSKVKVGFAGTGQTASDFWNNYTAPFQPLASLSNLTMADGTPTTVGLTVQNGAGHSAFTHPDLMYNCFCYSQDNGDITLTVTNLPSGHYDFYLYGHAGAASANTVFQLLIGGANYGNQPTTTSSDWALTNFVEGAQYVVYRSVAVTNGCAPVTIVAHPGSSGYALLNGMQISLAAAGAQVQAQPAQVAVVAPSGSAGATMQLEVRGAPGRVYAIQASTNVTDWVTIGLCVTDTDGSVRFADPDADKYPTRLYRVVGR